MAPQQDNIPSDTTKTAQEHDKELKMSTLTPDPLDPNPKEHWVTKSDPCRPHLQSTGIQASASELCLSGCKPPPWFLKMPKHLDVLRTCASLCAIFVLS